jgi:outer membrane protein OmpA-like peptidoglycan-associated protein
MEKNRNHQWRRSGGAVAAASLFAVAGCTGLSNAPVQRDAIAFGYDFEGAQPPNIIQVFNLGPDTVVQLRDARKNELVFLDQSNAEIPFRAVGHNLVLPGRLPAFTVLGPGQAARVSLKGYVPAPERSMAVGAGGGKAVASESEQEARLLAEIARIRREIADLKAIMATTSESSAAAAPGPARVLDILRVNFPDNSAVFDPRPDTERQLVELAKASKKVVIRGYTDSETATRRASQLAAARADSAKAFLVERGVDRSKIAIEAAAAGRFVADNKSREGRAANRRVEFHFS